MNDKPFSSPTMKEKYIYKLPEPKNKDIIKRIVGKQGKRLRDLEERAGIKPFDIRQKRNEVHILGTPKQIEIVKEQIKEIIDKELDQQKTDKDKLTVQLSPGKTGLVVGKKGKTLNQIQKNTDTDIHVYDNAAHIAGSPENRKSAEREIKAVEKKDLMEEKIKKRRTSDGVYKGTKQMPSCDSFNVVVDAAGSVDCVFELKLVDCPNPSWRNNVDYYKICKNNKKDYCSNLEQEWLNELQQFISQVLQKIKEEKHQGQVVKTEMWCHIGHVYINNVDEGEDKEQYSLEDLKSKFKEGNNDAWEMSFDAAIKELKHENLEVILSQDCVAKPFIRHDMNFVASDTICSKIKAKVFLGMDGKPNSRLADHDIDIRKDQQKSDSAVYLLCDQFHTRAKINILMPFEEMDCRLTIRTVASPSESESMDKTLERNICTSLDQIQIQEDGNVSMEVPEGFQCQFWRKCKRRSYPHTGKYNGDTTECFTIIISEEVVKEQEGIRQEETLKTDIHLHYDEWDRLLASGAWEPEQIVCKVPHFLEFVRNVQINIEKDA